MLSSNDLGYLDSHSLDTGLNPVSMTTIITIFSSIVDIKLDSIVKPKYQKSREIIFEDLLIAILCTNKAVDVPKTLGVSKTTYYNLMKKLFPNVSYLGSKSWKSYILTITGHKICPICNNCLSIKNFDSPKTKGYCKSCKVQKRKEYYEENKTAHTEYNAQRRAKVLQAIPLWANREKILEIYKNCPKGMQVDHIVPLQSKIVCGLHVENNLQYLTPEQNLSKSNKFSF